MGESIAEVAAIAAKLTASAALALRRSGLPCATTSSRKELNMTAETKALSTGAVLTITTGIVMVERFEGVHEAFEWVMGHPVWTHEMPRFWEPARDRVLAQYPDMPIKATAQDFQQVYADGVSRYGDTIEIAQGDAQRNVDPITSLVEATDHDR